MEKLSWKISRACQTIGAEDDTFNWPHAMGVYIDEVALLETRLENTQRALNTAYRMDTEDEYDIDWDLVYAVVNEKPPARASYYD